MSPAAPIPSANPVPPRHIGIIMDGNGRWAAAKGLPRLEGHRRGAERLIEIIDACIDGGIGTLTVFAFSAENWKRPLEEVSGLFKLGEWILRAHLARLEKRNVRLRVIGDISADTDWAAALQGVSCIVHCAARVHVMQDTEADPLAAFRRVNVEGARRLARSAAQAGVRRLVFLSSLKVLGEQTAPGLRFNSDTLPAPEDAYGRSKWEAEQALWAISERTGLEVVVVRPPLVHGPGVKANFRRLMQAVARGLPLPFGQVHNQRSLLALGNLTDLLQLCTRHPDAPGQTFLASDDGAWVNGQVWHVNGGAQMRD